MRDPRVAPTPSRPRSVRARAGHILIGTILASSGLFVLASAPPVRAGTDEDLAAARALFERNLSAIESRDFATYLDCYLQSEGLVRNGFGGLQKGYAGLAESVGPDEWPDRFEAFDLQVHRVSDGVVYGQYRYRVQYDDAVQEGISERVFLRTEAGWRIAVTTAFAAPDGALPALDGEATTGEGR